MRNLLLGIIIGLLVAPKKGSELREEIKEGVLNTYNEFKDMDAEDFKEKVDDVKQSIVNFDFNQAKDAITQKATEVSDQVKEKADEFFSSKPVQETIHTVKDTSSKLAEKATMYKTRSARNEGAIDPVASKVEADLKSEKDPFSIK